MVTQQLPVQRKIGCGWSGQAVPSRALGRLLGLHVALKAFPLQDVVEVRGALYAGFVGIGSSLIATRVSRWRPSVLLRIERQAQHCLRSVPPPPSRTNETEQTDHEVLDGILPTH